MEAREGNFDQIPMIRKHLHRIAAAFRARHFESPAQIHGEWFRKMGAEVRKINGIQIATGKGNLTEGPIGFQSEGADIDFRNILIRETK